MRNSLVRFSGMLMVAACVAPCFSRAEGDEYSDADIKEKFVFISRLIHGDENGSHIKKALRMAGNDTNRFARVLRELAEENTNQTVRAIRSLGVYKTTQSLPFLYSYATNATYGAEALKVILAIEGVTSNSLAAAESYLFLTNQFSFAGIGERSDTCTDLLKKAIGDSNLAAYRPAILNIATNFLQDVELMPNVLDGVLCSSCDGFRSSKRRLSILRSTIQRVTAELSAAETNNCEVWGKKHCYTFQTNYLQNAINELVAYPEANLPE